MELKMTAMQLPEQISFNYEEIKKAVTEKTNYYASLVYTDDQIKNAKRDRADLNGFRKALNDERIRLEKEYMVPFNTFKAQIQEILQIIDAASASIDKQVKAYEDQQKKAKWDQIVSFWGTVDHPAEIGLEQIADNKWLNASTKMEVIQAAIQEKVQQINSDLAVIEDLPEYQLEAKAMYISTLDLGRSVAQAHKLSEMAAQQKARDEELAKQKAARAEKKEEPDPEPMATPGEVKRQWIPFQAFLSKEEAMLLGRFLKDHGIQYKAI